jgi:hypothetical protein
MKPGQTHKLQNIIWREWRNCHDRTYAEQLYELVADTPVGWGTKLMVLLIYTVAGAALGLMIGFLITSNWLILRQFVWAGSIVGGVNGYLVSRDLSWRDWLERLSFNLPANDPSRGVGAVLGITLLGGLVFGPFFWVVIIGMFWTLGGLIKRLNRGQNIRENPFDYHPWFFWWRSRPPEVELEKALERLFQMRLPQDRERLLIR